MSPDIIKGNTVTVLNNIPFLQGNKSPINEENNGIQSNPSGRPICLSQMSRISTSTPTLDRMTRMVSEDQSPQRRRNGISRNPSDASLISKESISSLRSQRFELVFTIYIHQIKVTKYQTVFFSVCAPFSKKIT